MAKLKELQLRDISQQDILVAYARPLVTAITFSTAILFRLMGPTGVGKSTVGCTFTDHAR